MSRNRHNSSHAYYGPIKSRAGRLRSKLGAAISLERLDALLGKEGMDMGKKKAPAKQSKPKPYG